MIGAIPSSVDRRRAPPSPTLAVLDNAHHRRATDIEGGNRRVLIVDDDPGIRRLLVAFMHSRGFQLLEARNGNEALLAMYDGNVDVVVMDLMMPDVSGWEVLAHRALDDSLQKIPVIVVTAADVSRVENEVAGKHVWSVIAKPFDLDKLLTTVTACLEHTTFHAPVAA